MNRLLAPTGGRFAGPPTSEAGTMRRDLGGQRLRTASFSVDRSRAPWLAAAGLALLLVLIGGHPLVAKASQGTMSSTLRAAEQAGPRTSPVLAVGRAGATAAEGGGAAARPDTVTSSEPDYEGLNPVYVSVTNPDHEHPCVDSHPTETVGAAGPESAPDACGASDTRTEADELP
jgi:hypothetical protein